jgi:MYXO-CTERM domain-containing protein
MLALIADISRDDLCAPLGTCNHGFRVPTPLSLLDGAAHAVHAYGIDSEGEKNTQLTNSPGTLMCPPPPLLGWRRSVALPYTLSAWQFSLFADLVTIEDTALAALGQTIALPAVPLLVRADDGSPDIWLVDGQGGTLRRHIGDPAIAGAWHLDLEAAAVWPAADLALIPEGPPLRPRPILVKGSGPDIFVIDDNLDPVEAGSDGGDTSDTPTGTGAGGSGSGPGDEGSTTASATTGSTASEASGSGEGTAGVGVEDTGCGCRSTHGAGGAWLGAVVLLLVAPRRRRG